MHSRPVRRLLLAISILWSATGFAGTGPTADLAFDVRAWGVAEGLPGTHVNAAAEDEDGFLWLATLTGLVRFDGFSFRVFDESSGDLPSNRLTAVHSGSSGTLWVGTEQGHLVAVRDRVFRTVSQPPYPGSRIVYLAEDSTGTLWVSRDGAPDREGQALVWQLEGERLIPREDLDARWLARDEAGEVWTRTPDGGLVPFDARAVVALSLDADGEVWGHLPGGRLVRLRDGLADPLGKAAVGAVDAPSRVLFTREAGDRVDVFGSLGAAAIGSVPKRGWQTLWLIDRRGLIWETSGDGLQSTLRAYRGDRAVAEIPLGTIVRDVILDHEGNLWVSTMTRGLLRVSESTVKSLGPGQGVPLPVAVGLLPDGDVFIERAPLGSCPLHRITSGGSVPLDACGWLLVDRGGTEWTFDEGGLVGRRPGRVEQRVATDGTWFVEDPVEDGVLWVVARAELRRVDTRAAAGPTITGRWPMSAHRAIVADGEGGLWIGTTHGLYRLREGELERFGRDDGLPVEMIREILPDGRGGLWIGTYGGGLVHWDGSSFTALGRERGLPEVVVSSILDDGLGALWLAGNRGVHRVEIADLERALQDPGHRIRATSFGLAEAVPNPETTGRPGVRDAKGRLWFATFGGLLVVDPAKLARRESHPPRVSIVAIETAAGRFAPGAPVEIEPGLARDVTFDFTAIHLTAPESLRFRSRLEPLDADWVEHGEQRRTRYLGLPPGEYRFRVQASHSSEDWHEASSAQTVRVVPRFHETRSFTILLVVLALALVAVLWALATERVRRRAGELEAAVAERTVELAAERDVVARQAARLGELAEARSRLLAAISHELRTPLTLILGPLRDLRAAPVGTVPDREELEISLRSAERLRRLVDRLLEVARSEAGLERLACREQDLVAFVAALAEELRPLAERRGSFLRLDLPAEPVTAWFDPLQLETAVINLVANAVKHTPAGTTIEIAVRHGKEAAETEGTDTVQLVVRDDGPGIPAADVPRLFERFQRGSGESAAAVEGVGLGLALVREVVERHGGTVEVATGGGGTAFTVRLRRGSAHLRHEDLASTDWLEEIAASERAGEAPHVPAAAATTRLGPEGRRGREPAQVAMTVDGGGQDRTTVLVVDDNQDLRRLVRRQLEPRYRVLEASDGREALERIRGQLPDLVLSDVMMPDLDGFELCRAIRSDPATDFVPVVLLTAMAETGNRIEGLEEGADAYLAKPFDAGELRAVVDGLIASRRRLQERYASAARRRLSHALPVTPLGDDQLGVEDREYLRRVEEAIESRLHDEELTVDELARLVAQSRVSLYRHVKRLRGCSPSDWIRAARLERAAGMLARAEGSISEIAYAVGFKSTAHFSDSFLERYGMRPSRVRERIVS